MGISLPPQHRRLFSWQVSSFFKCSLSPSVLSLSFMRRCRHMIVVTLTGDWQKSMFISGVKNPAYDRRLNLKKEKRQKKSKLLKCWCQSSRLTFCVHSATIVRETSSPQVTQLIKILSKTQYGKVQYLNCKKLQFSVIKVWQNSIMRQSCSELQIFSRCNKTRLFGMDPNTCHTIMTLPVSQVKMIPTNCESFWPYCAVMSIPDKQDFKRRIIKKNTLENKETVFILLVVFSGLKIAISVITP